MFKELFTEAKDITVNGTTPHGEFYAILTSDGTVIRNGYQASGSSKESSEWFWKLAKSSKLKEFKKAIIDRNIVSAGALLNPNISLKKVV